MYTVIVKPSYEQDLATPGVTAVEKDHEWRGEVYRNNCNYFLRSPRKTTPLSVQPESNTSTASKV